MTSPLLSVSSCAWRNITLLFWPAVPSRPALLLFSWGIGNWRVQPLLAYQLLIELPAVKKMVPVCIFSRVLADIAAWSELGNVCQPRYFLKVNNLFLMKDDGKLWVMWNSILNDRPSENSLCVNISTSFLEKLFAEIVIAVGVKKCWPVKQLLFTCLLAGDFIWGCEHCRF